MPSPDLSLVNAPVEPSDRAWEDTLRSTLLAPVLRGVQSLLENACTASTPGVAARRMYQAQEILESARSIHGMLTEPSPGRRRRRSRGGILQEMGNGDLLASASDSSMDEEMSPSMMSYGVPGTGPGNPETFGTRAIQELLGAIGPLSARYTVDKSVAAIERARDGGNEALAVDLERKFRADLGLPSRVDPPEVPGVGENYVPAVPR